VAGAEGLFTDGLRDESLHQAAQDILVGTGIWAEGSEVRDLRLRGALMSFLDEILIPGWNLDLNVRAPVRDALAAQAGI